MKRRKQNWLNIHTPSHNIPWNFPALSGPTVSTLNNRIKRNFNPTLLNVEYKALNPVTIKWYVDGVKVGEAMDRVRSSSTSLRLSTEWLSRHPQSRYKVSVFDQQLGRVEGANPVTRSCRVKVVLGDLSNYNLCVKGWVKCLAVSKLASTATRLVLKDVLYLNAKWHRNLGVAQAEGAISNTALDMIQFSQVKSFRESPIKIRPDDSIRPNWPCNLRFQQKVRRWIKQASWKVEVVKKLSTTKVVVQPIFYLPLR